MKRKSSRFNKFSFLPILGAVFCFLFLCSCALTVEFSSDEAKRLLDACNSESFRQFKGRGTLSVSARNRWQSMRVAWVGEHPGKLRFQASGPFGEPLFLFILKDGTFFFRAAQDNRMFTGKGTARNIKRFLSISMHGEDLVSIFSGCPPVVPFQRAVVKKSSRPNEKILALYQRRNQLTEKIWFQEERALVEKALVFDGLGKLKYTMTFGSFKTASEKSFPHEIEISIRNGGALFTLHTDNFWTDFEVNPQAFTPNFNNMTLIDLDA